MWGNKNNTRITKKMNTNVTQLGQNTSQITQIVNNAIALSRNLFNVDTVKLNTYLDASGNEATATGWSASDFISVKPNTQYYRNDTANFSVFYDKDKNFISMESGQNVTLTPSNCYYLRLSNNTVADINNLQLELGTQPTSYISFYPKLNPKTIPKQAVTKDMLNFNVIDGTVSKNLFDKTKVTRGYYINFTNGRMDPVNTDYTASDYIPVSASTTYTKNKVQQFAFYDSSKTFISGITDGTLTFTTPINAAYARFTVMYVDLDAYQLELGSQQTAYETYPAKINISSIAKSSISADYLSFPALQGLQSKNLFDKSKVTTGHYINYTNGNAEAVGGYNASDFIAVQPNTAYTKNKVHQFAYYNSNYQYISGVTDGTFTFTTPANCAFVRCTVVDADLNSYQLELGGQKTAFEPYGPKVDPNSTRTSQNLMVVAKGNALFSTINDAVANAADSATNPVTILIMPGVYVESVKLIGRYITLVGQNRESCIIKTFTNDYENPPVDLSVNSHLKNLTIIADADGSTPAGGVNGLKSYAVHFDIAGRGYDVNNVLYQGTSTIRNCKLKSVYNSAIGIGTTNKQELILDNLELEGVNTNALYAHSYINSGATQQKLLVKNCTIKSNVNVAPVVLQDANWYTTGAKDTNDTVFTFIKNVAWNEVGGQANALDTTGYASLATGCITGYVKLGIGSFGNNITALNA